MTEQIVFYLLAGVIALSAIGVVTLSNVMHSALSLGLCLAGVAGLFAVLGTDFIFAAQILVYVGGIAVLILFVVLLAGNNSGGKLPRQVNRQWLPALIICTAFIWAFYRITAVYAGNTVKLPAAASVRGIAAIMLGEFAVPFELISVVLLASMTGAVLFGRRKPE
ncbi:MAG: NADH-quinone oxidoreductase subunit J [Elusimicrobia bacterium]|nr:NADH-quinone oxidoreductase subunit J [Elusimicrobiota bacterium]